MDVDKEKIEVDKKKIDISRNVMNTYLKTICILLICLSFFIVYYNDRLGHFVRHTIVISDKNSVLSYKNLVGLNDINGVKAIMDEPVKIIRDGKVDYLKDFTPIFYGLISIIIVIVITSYVVFKANLNKSIYDE